MGKNLAFRIKVEVAKTGIAVAGSVSAGAGSIKRFFAWHPRVWLLLDWYHRVKKFKEDVSLACRGRLLRNHHLRPYCDRWGMASWLRRSTI